MSFVSDDEPYVAVPSLISDPEFHSIPRYFDGVPLLRVVRGNQVPVHHFAGPTGPETIEGIAHWIVNFGPDLLRQLALWSLGVYTGKKIIDGLASEAGKDMWKGVKSLCRFILGKLNRGQFKKESSEFKWIEIRAVGPSRDGGQYFDVSIEFPIPSEENTLEQYTQDFESIICPLIGCLARKSPDIMLRVDRDDDSGWPWLVHRVLGGEMFGLNHEDLTYQQLSERRRDPLTESCLQALGLKAKRRQKHAKKRASRRKT